MAPVAISSPTQQETHSAVDQIKAALTGVNLDSTPAAPAKFDIAAYSQFDATPGTGTEFRDYSKDGKPVLSVRDVLGNEEAIKAVGRLVSERGVVFFRDAVITPDEQIELVEALGRAGGKPETSGRHVHPLTRGGSEFGDEISVISNKFVFDKTFDKKEQSISDRMVGKKLWHSDITFENVPSDYACLQIRTFPESGGGDTLWASAYEAYDRLSAPIQQLLEGLTATHGGPQFVEIARKRGEPLRENRGSPENVGQDLVAKHPVIRTNPVTGWKGLFVNGAFTKRINEVTQGESDLLLQFLAEHISANHDIQVRFRWEANNLAIWDNRSTFHAATHDVDDEVREGTRAVSLGERPYFDPKSKSRRAALAEAKKEQAQ